MTHPREEIARFLSGETRFIAAAWRGNPGKRFFVLPDGQADRFRDTARTQLRCIIPDCPRPEITVVARHPHRRDGFRHARGAGNLHGRGREGIDHIQGKTVIEQWLRSLPAGYRVIQEQGVDTQRMRRARVADVMAIEPATGRRFAFEIQYAAITQSAWWARTKEYRESDIPVVWLWGHHGPHLRAHTTKDGVTLVGPRGPSMTAGAQSTTPPTMWLNPAEQTIALPVRIVRDRLVPARRATGELMLLPLAEFELRAGMMWHPRFAQLLRDEHWVLAEERRERREQREREWVEQEERQERKQQAREAERRLAEVRRLAEQRDREPTQQTEPGQWRPLSGATPPFVPAPLQPGEVRYVGPRGTPDVTTPSILTRPGWCDLCRRALEGEAQAAGVVRHTRCARNRGVFF